MTKVTQPLFGTVAIGRIGNIGTFRRGASGPQFIKVPQAKKKKRKAKIPIEENQDIKALDVTAATYPGMAVAIFPADRVATTNPPISIIAITDPANGTANLYSDRVVYQPDPGLMGDDEMTYTAEDASGATAIAKIMIRMQKPKELKKKKTPDPYKEWLKQQLTLARKAWVKLPRKKYLFKFSENTWKTHYYREPDWPEFWNKWLSDHPFTGSP